MGIAEIANSVIEFVRDHQAWAAPVVFLLAFGESLAFLSLMVPGWAALVGIGALMGASGISFWPVWFAGAMGAALGDWISYWIGYKFKDVALVALSGLAAERRAVCGHLGHPEYFHRPLLRPAAGVCTARRRHLRNAVLAFSGRELLLGAAVGCGRARTRHVRHEDAHVDLGNRE
jgi:hypothetical protein